MSDSQVTSETNPSPPSARPAPPTGRFRGALRVVRSGVLTLGVLVTVFAAGHAAVDTLHQRAADVAPPEATPPLPVRAVALRLQPGFEADSHYTGRVEAARTTDLAFERGGRVMAVFVDEGDRVAADDLIAELDTDRLEVERARLEAETRRLEARLALAQRTQARQEQLNARGFATEQRLDETVTDEAALQASLAAVAAQLAAIEVDLGDSKVTAPFGGLIAARNVDPGAFAAPGAPVATLLEIGRPQARIGAPPDIALSLDRAETHLIEIGDRVFEGRIAAVRPDLDPVTRTVGVLFDLYAPAQTPASGAAPTLVMGETARLRTTRSVPTEGAWVPLSALQEGRRGLWTVYVAAPDADGWRLTQEAVETLHVAANRAFVRTSLSEGALIVASGVNRVARGQRVRPVPFEPAADATVVGVAP